MKFANSRPRGKTVITVGRRRMKEREKCVRASCVCDASFWLKLVPRGRRCTRGVNALARAHEIENEKGGERERGRKREGSDCDGKGG